MDELEAGLGLDAVSPGHTHASALPHHGALGRGKVGGGPAEVLLGGVNIDCILVNIFILNKIKNIFSP